MHAYSYRDTISLKLNTIENKTAKKLPPPIKLESTMENNDMLTEIYVSPRFNQRKSFKETSRLIPKESIKQNLYAFEANTVKTDNYLEFNLEPSESEFLCEPIKKDIFYKCNINRIQLDKKSFVLKAYSSDEQNKSDKFLMWAYKGKSGDYYIYKSDCYTDFNALEKIRDNQIDRNYIARISANLFNSKFLCYNKDNINILEFKNVSNTIIYNYIQNNSLFNRNDFKKIEILIPKINNTNNNNNVIKLTKGGILEDMDKKLVSTFMTKSPYYDPSKYIKYI